MERERDEEEVLETLFPIRPGAGGAGGIIEELANFPYISKNRYHRKEAKNNCSMLEDLRDRW